MFYVVVHADNIENKKLQLFVLYDANLQTISISGIIITMNTKIQVIDKEQVKLEDMKEAAQILKNGGLVAFPTETVYGLGGDGLREDAAKKIYQAKGRPSDNPLIIHIADMDMLGKLVTEIPKKAKLLADKFWPGPLTMIFQKSEKVPLGTTGGLNTVAIRMPNHPIALALIRESNIAIAAPSANTSGRPSPTLAKHVMEDMDGKIEMIIDGGAVGIGIESTIVDMTSEIPVILRPGYITKAMLEEVVGKVEIDKAILSKNIDKNFKPKAPGMKYKHYAPKGDLTIYEGDIEKVVDAINRIAGEKEKEGVKVGIIATEETKDRYKAGNVVVVGSRKNEAEIAQGLYRVLRDFDDMQVEYIYSEGFTSGQLGNAIMNRLLKAAGYQVITV